MATTKLDPINGLGVCYKKPSESKAFWFDLTKSLGGDLILTVVNPIDVVKRNNVQSSSDIAISEIIVSIDAKKFQLKISGGSDQEDYKLDGQVTTMSGDIIEFDGMLYVREDF